MTLLQSTILIWHSLILSTQKLVMQWSYVLCYYYFSRGCMRIASLSNVLTWHHKDWPSIFLAVGRFLLLPFFTRVALCLLSKTTENKYAMFWLQYKLTFEHKIRYLSTWNELTNISCLLFMLVNVILGNPVVVGYLTLPVRNQCVVDDVFRCYVIAVFFCRTSCCREYLKKCKISLIKTSQMCMYKFICAV